MKTFFRVSMLGLLMIVLTAFTSVAVMAQDDEQKEKTALYTCFVENYDKYTIAQQEKALGCANDYIKKFPTDTQYVDYFKGQIPDIEKWISEKKKADKAAADAERKRKEKLARLNRIDAAYKAAAKTVTVANWQEAFSAGEAVINNDKEFALDTKILLANAGYEYLVNAKTPIDDFNNKIISKAETVIADINSGVTSKNYGVFNSELKTKDATLAKMNAVIGKIKLDRQKKDAEGMSYLYKSLNYNKDWRMYAKIGAWYRNKAAEIGEQRVKLDKKDEANLPKIKEYLAMERGYLSRSIDAFARSYSKAKMDSEVTEQTKTALFGSLKELFQFRFTQEREKPMKTDASINSYIASVNAKTMPNPTSTVEPIPLEEPKPAEESPTDAKSEMKDGDSTKPAVKKEAKTSMKNGTTRSRKVAKAKSGN